MLTENWFLGIKVLGKYEQRIKCTWEYILTSIKKRRNHMITF